eukprot:3374767-Rhodomonas_salina.1
MTCAEPCVSYSFNPSRYTTYFPVLPPALTPYDAGRVLITDCEMCTSTHAFANHKTGTPEDGPISRGIHLNMGTVALPVPFSITCWVNIEDYDGSTIFSRDYDAGNNELLRYAVSSYSGYHLNVQHTGGILWCDAVSAAVPLAEWVHLTVTVSATVITLYQGAGVVGTCATPAGIPSGSTTMYIGTDWGNTLVGRVADLRLYGRALSAAEVGH